MIPRRIGPVVAPNNAPLAPKKYPITPGRMVHAAILYGSFCVIIAPISSYAWNPLAKKNRNSPLNHPLRSNFVAFSVVGAVVDPQVSPGGQMSKLNVVAILSSFPKLPHDALATADVDSTIAK